MANFINHSFFPAIKYAAMDQYDACFDVVTSRITYDIKINAQNGTATLQQAKKQSPLCYNDIYYGDAAGGSIHYESDLAPYKPKTDIVIHATAFAPGGRAAATFNVSAKVGDKLKTLRVFGPRCWRISPAGWVLDTPLPVDRLDILYEYASGGRHELNQQVLASPENPVGAGWYPEAYLRQCKEIRLPAHQIEAAEIAVKKISEQAVPQGFGFFGKSWRQRIQLAGTYDQEWLAKRHPYLPGDFDFRYWCGAHPDLQMAHPAPYENIPVELMGLISSDELPDQRLCFVVPVETLFVFIKTRHITGITKDMTLDTIIIDMQARKVFCTYRVCLSSQLCATEMQLRYIAVADREKQKQAARQMNNDKHCPTFIPLPPGLLKGA